MPKPKSRPTLPAIPTGSRTGLHRRQLKPGPKNPKVGLQWWRQWPLIVVLLLTLTSAIVWYLAIS